MPQRLRVTSQSDEGAKSTRQSGKSRGEVVVATKLIFCAAWIGRLLQPDTFTDEFDDSTVEHKHW